MTHSFPPRRSSDREFVRDHVILREIALGAEAVLKLVEKARVEIDALIAGAVERPHRRLRRAAARLAVARVEDELGHLETLTGAGEDRSEEHTSELQSLMRISYAVFCLKKKKTQNNE